MQPEGCSYKIPSSDRYKFCVSHVQAMRATHVSIRELTMRFCWEVVMLPAHGAHLISLRLPLHMGRSSVMSSHKTTPKLKRSALCVTLPASGCRPHQSLITYVARAVCHSLIISPVSQNFHATPQMRISMGTVVSTSDDIIIHCSCFTCAPWLCPCSMLSFCSL